MSTSPTSPLGLGLAQTLTSIAQSRGVSGALCETLALATRALVAASEGGHVCLPLTKLPGNTERLRRQLLQTGLVGMAGSDARLPLMIDEAGRLYLYRFFDYEMRLAAAVERLCASPSDLSQMDRITASDTLPAALPLFRPGQSEPSRTPTEPDWQQVAAALALMRRLTIISGGPGTGKTTTVVTILAGLLTQQPDLRIVLAAPTGKAAARMLDALRQRAASLSEALRQRLPTESFTIHRLLGVLPHSSQFRHSANNPLALDVLVVDEASMLDLALATRLLEALPAHVRLILLGDKDQLSAVEAGAVFNALSADPTLSAATAARIASLCKVDIGPLPLASPDSNSRLIDSTVWLRSNFRFAPDSAIGLLAHAIRETGSDARAALAALQHDSGTVNLTPCRAGPLPEALLDRITAGYDAFITAMRQQPGGTFPAARAVLDAFEQHRVLCALRQGPRGLVQLNLELTRRVRQQLKISPNSGQPWFAGRPVIITRNDYKLQLYNGDIGIALPDAGGQLMVWFPDQQGGMRAFAPARLPAHETAFATTVHKAQGSEFRHVSFILPSQDNPVLTRELIYTAVTRASACVSLYGEADLLAQAIATPTLRESGLTDRLMS